MPVAVDRAAAVGRRTCQAPAGDSHSRDRLRSLLHQLLYKLHVRIGRRVLGRERFLHVSHPLATAGHAEVVAFLEDGARFGHGAEDASSGSLAGVPVPLPLVVFQVELRVAVPGDPDTASRDADTTAHGHEQGGEFFAVSEPVVEGLARAFDLTVEPLGDFGTHPVVDGFDLVPRQFLIRHNLLRSLADHTIVAIDVGTRPEVDPQRAGY